jgi:hypothetical protein
MLSYSYLEPDAPSGIPPRKVNGGLYTGSAFPTNASWGNISVVPDAHIYVGENLKSANPPPTATYHIPGYTREGNNTQQFPNHKKYSEKLHLQCHPSK